MAFRLGRDQIVRNSRHQLGTVGQLLELSHLKWATNRSSMGCHIVKTTIEIADDLFERAKRLARKEKTTFRSLTEQGLRLVMKEKDGKSKKLPPLITVPGELTDEFKNAPWEKIRDEIYKGHGA